MKNIKAASKRKDKIPKNQIILVLKLRVRAAPLTHIKQKMNKNIINKLTIIFTWTNKVNHQNKKKIKIYKYLIIE